MASVVCQLKVSTLQDKTIERLVYCPLVILIYDSNMEYMSNKIKNGSYASPTSSPPTPPSPLPISTGPGNQRYFFTPSPSPSPPFSPPSPCHNSAERLPFLRHDDNGLQKHVSSRVAASVFSLDRQEPGKMDSQPSCLKDLLEWFVERCCNCCSTPV
ncbi:hypothetical protein QQ045_012726 [Rhodiola kirilowii]